MMVTNHLLNDARIAAQVFDEKFRSCLADPRSMSPGEQHNQLHQCAYMAYRSLSLTTTAEFEEAETLRQPCGVGRLFGLSADQEYHVHVYVEARNGDIPK